MSDKRVAVFGGFLLIDFLLSVTMLVTDKNLQSDFGAMSTPPYYLHWDGVLGMALLDVILGVVLVALAFRTVSPSRRKLVVIGGIAWSVLAVLAMVGIVSAYSQVGFQNMSQFSQYLFGVTPYPGALSYIPWLYDLLLAAYVLTALIGVGVYWVTRSTAPTPDPQ
jgi:hypothetical protein